MQLNGVDSSPGDRCTTPFWALLVACALACSRLGAAESTVESPAVHAAGEVRLDANAEAVSLGNREVGLVFETASGRMRSLTYRGRELLARGGAYLQVAYTSNKDRQPKQWKFRIVRREPGLAEIAFETADPDCAFDLGAHYIVRTEEPGFYYYLTYGHDATRSPGVHRLTQYNLCMRVDPGLFTTAAVDDARIKPFPKPALLGAENMVMDATYWLPDGTYYSKYFFVAEMDEKQVVHGTMGEGLGLWFVMPSHEHLNGGPEHQELTVHQTDTSPVLLYHAVAAHYGAGSIGSDSKDGSWHQASAPCFVYVNTAASQSKLWQDAKQRAAREVAAWPYPWLGDAEFQLRRGTVTGRLTFDDHTPMRGARVILAAHEAEPTPLAWNQQWRGYRFYSWADRDGRFSISKVRPGQYDVYAWVAGHSGEFLQQSVRVGAEQTTSLGELVWHQPQGRDRLWQIGVADRSAGEFGFAENFRDWGLWDRIAAATPNGVTYVVGQSRQRDWPFEMAVTQNPDRSWRLPVWRVQFDNSLPRNGKGILTLGIAAFQGRQQPQIRIVLNGEPIGAVRDLKTCGAATRSGIHAGYQEREVEFDAARLKPGRNMLALELPAPGQPPVEPRMGPAAAVLWDFLRLEVVPMQQASRGAEVKGTR